MEKLDINTLEGWNKLADDGMRKHLLEQGIEPTLEAIQKGHQDARKKCDQWELEMQKEKAQIKREAQAEADRLKSVAEEVKMVYMQSYMSELPMSEIEAICKLLNTQGKIENNAPNHWNIGAIYLYGVMQGKREERSRRCRQND